MSKKLTLAQRCGQSNQKRNHFKILNAVWSLLLLLVVFTAGCRKDNFKGEIKGKCPVVTTDPVDKAVDVVLNKVITITFNTAMNEASINKTSFFIKQGTTLVSGAIAATTNAAVFTFTPDVPLLPFVLYTGTVTTGAMDTLHTALANNYVWSFTTIPQVTLTANPVAGGTIAGAGTFAQNSSVTVTATPNAGFVFTNWTDSGNAVSTSASYQFTMTGNRALVANFAVVPAGKFAVNLSSNPAAGGTTSGSGLFNTGASVTINASSNAGYNFINWTEGSVVASTSANYTFALNANRTLVANFSQSAVGIGPPVVNLGAAGTFTLLTKSGISTTGITSVQGDIGVSPAAASAITGFGLIMDANGQSAHTPIVTGKVYAADYSAPTPSNMTTAINDMQTAYTTANNLVTPAPIVDIYAGDLSGRILPPGLYKFSTGVLITSAGVTLSGSANDTWVLQIAQDLTVNNSAKVTLIGGAQAKNIVWVVAGQATLGTNTDFSGIILSKTLISLNTGAKVTGRLLAQTAVTLNASTVVLP